MTSLGKQLVMSYGAITEIFAFLTAKELIFMQALNRWMYEKAVSRVQTRISMRKTLFYFPQPWVKDTNPLIAYELAENNSYERKEFQQIGGNKNEFRITHAGKDCFMLGGIPDENMCAIFVEDLSSQTFTVVNKQPMLFKRDKHSACTTPD